MISIPESGTSSVIFYLDKISSFTDPYYIFELTNHNSKKSTFFTGSDVSPSPNYYNQFVFENGATYSATQSKFDLSSGTYFLNIYETEFEGITNSASGSSIYQNEIKIEGDKKPDITYFGGRDSKTEYFGGRE